MAFTNDVTTDVGKMRLIIMDRDSQNPIFQDEDLTAFFNIMGDILRGSAMALRAIAANQVYVLKYIKLLQLVTDGPKVGAELRLEADALDERANFVDATTAGMFGWAEFVDDEFAARERIWKEWERRAVSISP